MFVKCKNCNEISFLKLGFEFRCPKCETKEYDTKNLMPRFKDIFKIEKIEDK